MRRPAVGVSAGGRCSLGRGRLNVMSTGLLKLLACTPFEIDRSGLDL